MPKGGGGEKEEVKAFCENLGKGEGEGGGKL